MEAARVRDESAPPSTIPAPDPVRILDSPPAGGQPSRLVETLVCSGQGQPLYQWQCPDPVARVDLLKKISQFGARLGRLLPLGKFDRLEIQNHDSRAVAQAQSDRMVFVRVAAETPAPPP